MSLLSEIWPPEGRAVGLVRRVACSTVVWSWAFNFLRLASGLLLLPLLLRQLSAADLGMYYVFLTLNGIVVVLDLGFAHTIGRFVSYAMGGAKTLTAIGLPNEEAHREPNYSLLWELLFAARFFYRTMALATVLLLGTLGSVMVAQKAAETSSIHVTWAAWFISVVAVGAESYFAFWNMFLRNLNQVLAATRISMIAYALRLLLACALLLLGGGLLSLPVASLFTSFIIWRLSKKSCLQVLSPCLQPARERWRAHFRTLWPNSWRIGLYVGGAYLSSNANVLVCSTVFGLEATAKYGLSLQVISIITGMAAVWTQVKWPAIGQLIAKQQLDALRDLLWPRMWLQLGTFALMAAGAITAGPFLIHFVGRDKEMLPFAWLLLLATNGFLEGHCSLWNTLISMWNRLPMLWPSLITNAAALALNLVLVHLPDAQPGLLVLGPLLASAALNYWYWPRYGARTLGLSWFQFLRYGLHQGKSPV